MHTKILTCTGKKIYLKIWINNYSTNNDHIGKRPHCYKLLFRRNKQLIQELGKPAPGSNDLYFSAQYSQSFLVQCLACLWKQHWSYWRNPPYTAVRFFFTVFIGLMFGTIFWDLGMK